MSFVARMVELAAAFSTGGGREREREEREKREIERGGSEGGGSKEWRGWKGTERVYMERRNDKRLYEGRRQG